MARENDSKTLLNITWRKAKLTSKPGRIWQRNVHFGAIAYTRQRPILIQSVYSTRRRNDRGERRGRCIHTFTSHPAHNATRSADQESGFCVTSGHKTELWKTSSEGPLIMMMMVRPDKMLVRQGRLHITRIDATMTAVCFSRWCRPQLHRVAQEANPGDCQSIERHRCVSARVSET